jgi:hypothetical protein
MFPFNFKDTLDRDGIQCLTNGPMVYVRNLKCASTFFGSSFEKYWRWEPILWGDINWKYQHVFGHMLDPLERRIKGIAEYINLHSLHELFHSDINFQDFVKNTVAFDEHSNSYYDTFGNLVYHIDWIPISGYTHEQVIEFTERLMRHYGIRTLKNWDWGNVHLTHPEKKVTTQKLKQLCDWQSQPPQAIQWYFERDIKLYQHIHKKFDPMATHWSETTWLRI